MQSRTLASITIAYICTKYSLFIASSLHFIKVVAALRDVAYGMNVYQTLTLYCFVTLIFQGCGCVARRDIRQFAGQRSRGK
jgi:hypothetical protein